MKNRQRFLALALVAAVPVAGAADIAVASVCSSALPSSPESVATGDVATEPFVTNTHIGNYWSAYAMESGDWDEGWGYSDPGNVNLPLARVLNAMFVLQFSAPPGAPSTNFLTYSHSYVVNSIDEIQTNCSTAETKFAYTTWGFWVDDWTRLYLPFFYGLSVPERAGTLVHEARHANEVGHDGGTGCPRAASCDTSWNYQGANRYQVQWLWYYAGTSPAAVDLRLKAIDRANAILATGFNTDPGFRI